ncbi:MAG: acetyl-CoA carboxylase carboxyl transferase subunit alpha, partial [Pseudomonadota bacterium]|nr:acetyl-CoA carboxylase carboxyl transferase subunit alpha [Pseudomonadota bacterium]
AVDAHPGLPLFLMGSSMGGAIALATGNRVVMFEHAIYSVISPEGCASILWRSGDHAKDAAEALRITSSHMKDLGVIDAIVPEPLGGAHRDQAAAIASLGDTCFAQLQELQAMDGDSLVEDRAQKYLAMGDSAG